MNENLLRDTRWRGHLILVLQKAIVEQFNTTDWEEFGYATGQYDFIRGHGRLLRSLYFSDEDYGRCVFQVIQHFATNDTHALAELVAHPKLLPYLKQRVPEKIAELGSLGEHVAAIVPPPTASDVVRRALLDSDSLLTQRGASSAIDRMHTALHGYLRSICSDHQIPIADDASITICYKAIRTQHPAFKQVGDHESEINRILNSFASAVDALNTLRNHASAAHPNAKLLGNEEGILTVNAVRTIFHYLQMKIGK